MPNLFDSLVLRGITLSNRIGISPMCMYSANDDGKPTDWHLAHYFQRAIGGAAMVIVEETAVTKNGRITSANLGIWDDSQIDSHSRLANAISHAGAIPAIQLGHAGRRAGRLPPWLDGPANSTWEIVSASDIPMISIGYPFEVPRPLTDAEINDIPKIYVAAAKRAITAGYKLIEIHTAHGYLLHQFLSPLSNRRNDRWGGDFEGRTRLPLKVIQEVRAAIPEDMPLAMRVSHTDDIEGGWSTVDTIEFVSLAKKIGVDLVDVSSAGLNIVRQKLPSDTRHRNQVSAASVIKQATNMNVAAVGLITDAKQAQTIISEGKADMVLIGRAALRDPYWPMRAAAALGKIGKIKTPPQYLQGWNKFGDVTLREETAIPLPPLMS